MKTLKLTLSNEEGEVLESWTIADEYDFDPEDPDEPWGDHDFYLLKKEDSLDVADEIGKAIIDRIVRGLGK